MNSEIRLLVPAFVGCALVAEAWSKPDPNHWSFHEVAERSVADLGVEYGILVKFTSVSHKFKTVINWCCNSKDYKKCPIAAANCEYYLGKR